MKLNAFILKLGSIIDLLAAYSLHIFEFFLCFAHLMRITLMKAKTQVKLNLCPLKLKSLSGYFAICYALGRTNHELL